MSVLFTISQVINCFWSSLFCDLLCKGYFDMLLYQFRKTIMVGLVYQWPCILFIHNHAFCLSTFMHFVDRQSCILFINVYAFCLSTIMHFVYQRLCILFIDNHAFCLSRCMQFFYWRSCISFIITWLYAWLSLSEDCVLDLLKWVSIRTENIN